MSTLMTVGVSCVDKGRTEASHSVWASGSPQRKKESVLPGASWRILSVGWGVEGHVQEDIGFTWRSIAGCFPAKGAQV